MSMPKGMKHEHGYATVKGVGKGYREISDIMTKDGFKMNHASARNYFIRAMEKLAKPVSKITGRPPKEIAADARFQSAIAELVRSNTSEIDF
jgi:beta-lactamase class A